jgi:hypothetical protein
MGAGIIWFVMSEIRMLASTRVQVIACHALQENIQNRENLTALTAMPAHSQISHYPPLVRHAVQEPILLWVRLCARSAGMALGSQARAFLHALTAVEGTIQTFTVQRVRVLASRAIQASIQLRLALLVMTAPPESGKLEQDRIPVTHVNLENTRRKQELQTLMFAKDVRLGSIPP